MTSNNPTAPHSKSARHPESQSASQNHPDHTFLTICAADHSSGTEVLARGLIGTCAQMMIIITTPPLLSDALITHSLSSFGLSSFKNCWSRSGLINCSWVIQVASLTGKPRHMTKYCLIIFLLILIFLHRRIFSISQ